MFYRAVNPSQDTPCPRCGKTLWPETGVYVIATRQGGRPGDHLMISGNFGFYCAACPTVVMDPEQVVDVLQIGATGWDVGDGNSAKVTLRGPQGRWAVRANSVRSRNPTPINT
jgi:hypothetical protein